MKKYLLSLIVATFIVSDTVASEFIRSSYTVATDAISDAAQHIYDAANQPLVTSCALGAASVGSALLSVAILEHAADPLYRTIIAVSDFVHGCVNGSADLLFNWKGQNNALKRQAFAAAAALGTYLALENYFKIQLPLPMRVPN